MGIGSIWKRLPVENRRWIVAKGLLATAAINAVLNAAIAWLGVRGQDTVAFWGVPLVEASIFWNVVGTLFLLPLITCLLATTAVWRDLGLGALSPLPGQGARHRWLAALPAGRLRRGAALGAAAVVGLAPPLLLALAALGPADLSRTGFVVCQTAFAVLLGALVTPIVALRAMADPVSEG